MSTFRCGEGGRSTSIREGIDLGIVPAGLKAVVVEVFLYPLLQPRRGRSRRIDDSGTDICVIDIRVLFNVPPDLPTVRCEVPLAVPREDSIPMRRLDLNDGDKVAGFIDEDVHPTTSCSD